MKITYERLQIDHCESSPYVKDVTIKNIKPAENSDFLELISFEEMGWQTVGKKNIYKVGQKVTFLPPDSVLPFELSEELEVTKYLSKGRIRVTRLRGNRSEGLIVEKEKIEPYLPYILKWEDLPTIQMGGETERMSNIPWEFEKFYKMPNILNEPKTFDDGEMISYSEKIHGTNVRCAILPHPETGEDTLYVGSHNIVLRESENIYWRMIKPLADKLPRNVVFFGEIYGRGIQHLHYDTEPKVIFFSAMVKGEYLFPLNFSDLCIERGLPFIDQHHMVFDDIEEIRRLADFPSEYTNKHEREGIVMVSCQNKGRMAKCIGFKYLEKKNRTERH